MLKDYSFLVGTIPATLPQGLGTPGIGEERWGLNIVETLLSFNHQVFIPPGKGIWKSDLPIPNNLILQTIPEKSLYFSYYYPIETMPKCAKYILCKFDDFGKNVLVPDNVLIVHPYPAGARWHALQRQTGNSCQFLPHIIKEQNTSNTFDNLNIFWTGKNGIDCHSQDRNLSKQVLEWASRQMDADNRLTFTAITLSHGKTEQEGIVAWRNHPWFKSCLEKFGDRVRLLGVTSYDEIHAIMAQTKIVLNLGNFNHTYGGSSLEAAAHGIPSIQFSENPFITMEEALSIPDSRFYSQYIGLIDKLFNDKIFYEIHSAKYRAYVKDVYSPQSFMSRLETLL